ncbi:hypothetical protein, partial [Staphylococcus aureus]
MCIRDRHIDALGISMKETLDKCKEILGGETIIASTRREPLSSGTVSVSYTHLRAHETLSDLVCRLLLEKKLYTLQD